MSDIQVIQGFIDHIGWVAALFGLSLGAGGLLIALGVMKNKVTWAAERAAKLKQELYREDGVTNYVPRDELNKIVNDLTAKIIETRSDMFAGCNANRTECREVICNHIELLRKDNDSIHRAIDLLEEKYHDQNLGFVALSTQLSILLRSAGQTPPAEIEDIERRLRASAADRMRRYTDDRILKKRGGDD